MRGTDPRVVIGGLVVATLLTLVFLPALYVAWFRIRPAAATAGGNEAANSVEAEGEAKGSPLEAAA